LVAAESTSKRSRRPSRHGVKLYGCKASRPHQSRHQRIGAVNLAALDELTSARERKTFLDAQSADLNEAITTLEAPSTRSTSIARSARRRLSTRSTNTSAACSTLFGGGTARLVMTGDEILDAGGAGDGSAAGQEEQPIHLLSGGEKALDGHRARCSPFSS